MEMDCPLNVGKVDLRFSENGSNPSAQQHDLQVHVGVPCQEKQLEILLSQCHGISHEL